MSSTLLEAQALRFSLAARLTSYPDPRFSHWVRQLSACVEGELPASGLLELACTGGDLDLARSEYVELFDRGDGRTPLYETEYGRMRGMSKGTELSDINGFYLAFGLAPDDGPAQQEMADHIAVELEFYAVLLARQAALLEAADAEGADIVEDARRKFLVDHLGRLAPAIAQRENVIQSALYGAPFSWAAALVAAECRALSAQPAPLDFHSLAPAPESEQCCSAVANPLGSGPAGGQVPP